MPRDLCEPTVVIHLPPSPIFHTYSLNTLPLGSSYHKRFKITFPRSCRNLFSSNTNKSFNFLRLFGNITGTRGYGKSSYKTWRVVFYNFPGFSKHSENSFAIFQRLLLKRTLPEPRVTPETRKIVIRNQNQLNKNHYATATFTPKQSSLREQTNTPVYLCNSGSPAL